MLLRSTLCLLGLNIISNKHSVNIIFWINYSLELKLIIHDVKIITPLGSMYLKFLFRIVSCIRIYRITNSVMETAKCS